MSASRVSDIRFIGDMTGVGITTPWDVLGTDLGIPVYSPSRRRMYFLFGDTFGIPEGAILKDNKICAVGDPSGHSTNWRGTIAGYTDQFDLSDGIRWDGFLDNGDGKARALIRAHYATNAQEKEVTKVERFAFYDLAKKAHIIVSTGEKALYANLILKKGVL